MMNLQFWLIPLTVLLCLTTATAQPLGKLKEDALKLYERGKYQEAVELLTRYEQEKSGDATITQALGIAAYHANQLPKAKQYLSALVLNNKKIDPSVFLYLGRTYHAELNFKEAIKNYKSFLSIADDKHPERRRVVGDVKRCAVGMRIVIQPDLALVENLGETVNSRFDEFAPLQSVTNEDRIYFASARVDSEGGLRNDQNLEDIKNGHYFSDIYLTDFENGDWQTPARLENELINSSYHEWLLDITNEGKTLMFFRTQNGFSGDILIDTFKSQEETRSLPPKLKSPLLPENGDNSIFFFNDSILIFAAKRPEGFGGLDLYYSVLANDTWQTPKNLGKHINSPFDETTPYLAKDGRTLYFSSNSTASMGGFDIFKSVFNTDSLRFMPPVNLGKPINSAGNDLFFRLTQDGMRGYFCSDRKDGFGERDIYTALFKNFQREQNPSVPIVFYLIEQLKTEDSASENKTKEQKTVEIQLEPLFYENDDDLLRGGNLANLRAALNLIKQFPNLKIVLTCHSLEGEKASFDLYFSMKRVEKIAKYLIDNGLTKENIILKSVGSNYPIATTILNGAPNPIGEKLNRRIDLVIADLATPPTPIKVNYAPPVISPLMQNPAGERLRGHTEGLSYKIQIITTKRIFDGDILAKYGDSMMEASGTEGVYSYTIGLHQTFAGAEKMQKDLFKDNMRDALIVPYMNGLRLSEVETRLLSKKYPDLLNYIASKKRP